MPSGLIRRVDYVQSRTLSVWLVTSENRHDYQDVPAAFRRAFSKGRFFNAHIRNHF
ncbi:KTSC domain-containing protein [Pararhizobium sp. A13]|uniref:KTSC domain-containing protein n=1 Tax=Pararhizobium sp. A13 TaxID=3133975 RepID=UPI00311B0878